MPVTFEQPDPFGFAAAAAQAGGYVQQYNADRQFALQSQALQAQTARFNQQAALESQRMQLGAAMGGGGRGGAGGEIGAVTQADVYAANRQQQLAAMQQAGQSQRMNQQLANALATQQNEFSQSQQQQLMRLKQADGFIDQQAADGGWSADEIAQAKSQVRGVMGPLQLKAAQAQIQSQHALADQRAANTSMDVADRTAFAKQIDPEAQGPGGVMRTKDGREHPFIISADGKPIWAPAGARAAGAAAGGAARAPLDANKVMEEGVKMSTDENKVFHQDQLDGNIKTVIDNYGKVHDAIDLRSNEDKAPKTLLDIQRTAQGDPNLEGQLIQAEFSRKETRPKAAQARMNVLKGIIQARGERARLGAIGGGLLPQGVGALRAGQGTSAEPPAPEVPAEAEAPQTGWDQFRAYLGRIKEAQIPLPSAEEVRRRISTGM